MAPQRPRNRVQRQVDVFHRYHLRRNRFGRVEPTRPNRPLALTNALRALFLPKGMNWMQRQTFVSYIISMAAVEQRMVSGDPRLQPRSSSLAINSTAALLDWFIDLISLGFSLGRFLFEAKHFIIDEGGCLKGSSELFDHVCPATTSVVEAHMDRLAVVIADEIYQGAILPLDAAHLVYMLHDTAYAARNIPLLKMHATRETDMGRSGLYGKVFNQMEIIKKVDEDKHARIIGNLSPSPNWITSAMHNMHLQRVLRYRNNKAGLVGMLVAFLSNNVNYTQGAESQMTCRRNGEAHLPKDYCVNVAGMRIALEAALETMLVYNPSIQQALNRTVTKRPLALLGTAHTPTEPAFAKDLALALATVIHNALSIEYQSVEVAEAAVEAAIDTICSSASLDAQAMIAARYAASVAAASAVARLYQLPYPPPQPYPVEQMFEQDEVDLMFSLVNPGLLAELQKSMYDEGELRGPIWSGPPRIVRLPPLPHVP